MRPATGLHADHTGRKIADKLRQAFACQHFAQHYSATPIGSEDMEDMLCQIDAQHSNRHWWTLAFLHMNRLLHAGSFKALKKEGWVHPIKFGTRNAPPKFGTITRPAGLRFAREGRVHGVIAAATQVLERQGRLDDMASQPLEPLSPIGPVGHCCRPTPSKAPDTARAAERLRASSFNCVRRDHSPFARLEDM
jgi:hypothetical protein